MEVKVLRHLEITLIHYKYYKGQLKIVMEKNNSLWTE